MRNIACFTRICLPTHKHVPVHSSGPHKHARSAKARARPCELTRGNTARVREEALGHDQVSHKRLNVHAVLAAKKRAKFSHVQTYLDTCFSAAPKLHPARIPSRRSGQTGTDCLHPCDHDGEGRRRPKGRKEEARSCYVCPTSRPDETSPRRGYSDHGLKPRASRLRRGHATKGGKSVSFKPSGGPQGSIFRVLENFKL